MVAAYPSNNFQPGRHPVGNNNLKRPTLLCAVGLIAACSSSAALAHVDVGVTFGIPAPVYVEPPPVVYEAPPPAVYAPAPVYYGNGYGYDYRYRDDRRWREHDRDHHWRHHHDDDDD